MSTFESKSGVNVRRLVQNIQDQYDFAAQIAALLELVANALDAHAARIELRYDAAQGQIIVEDDGHGMTHVQFKDYHDFAATSKSRGSGIGFAGQGAKLALNFCTHVVTETWSREWRGHSDWHLKGNDAPYRVVEDELPSLDHHGTRITLYLGAESKGFYSIKLIERTLFEHFYPLIDRGLRAQYPNLIKKYEKGVTLALNGRPVSAPALEAKLAYFKEFDIRVKNEAKAFGWFGVYTGDDDLPIPPGIMLCTYGKVIERSYLKKEPRDKERLVGWIEAPYLIEAVTTDKGRFIKGNARWETFFKRAQTAFTAWLEAHQLVERASRRAGHQFAGTEREINSILRHMPELAMFASHARQDAAALVAGGELLAGEERVLPRLDAEVMEERVQENNTSEPTFEEKQRTLLMTLGEAMSGEIRPRVIRGGVHILEEARDDKSEESWFDGTVVTINQAHPAYRKASQSNTLQYHIFKCVCLSVIEFTMENKEGATWRDVLELQRRFFALWGSR
jgi:Histidine kinase-, DNA gyrase B-, and HSP90-like ATPase